MGVEGETNTPLDWCKQILFKIAWKKLKYNFLIQKLMEGEYVHLMVDLGVWMACF